MSNSKRCWGLTRYVLGKCEGQTLLEILLTNRMKYSSGLHKSISKRYETSIIHVNNLVCRSQVKSRDLFEHFVPDVDKGTCNYNVSYTRTFFMFLLSLLLLLSRAFLNIHSLRTLTFSLTPLCDSLFENKVRLSHM